MALRTKQFLKNILLTGLITSFFLWLAFRSTNLNQISSTLNNISWIYFIFPLFFWGIGSIARAFRWRLLLDKKLIHLDALGILSIVYMLNSTIPLRAGELARLYFVNRENESISGWTVLTTVLTETILDMSAIVFLLAFVVLSLNLSLISSSTSLITIALVLISFVILLVFAHYPKLAHHGLVATQRLFPFVKRLHFEKLLDKLLEGIVPLSNWVTFFQAIFWTAVIWLSSICAIWSSSLAFHQIPLKGDFLPAMVLVLVATSLGAIVPFTFAGIGPFEAGFVFALGIVGISQEVSVTFGLITHALMIFHFVVWGIIGIVIMKVSFTDIQSISTEIRSKTSIEE